MSSKIHVLSREIWQISNVHTAFFLSTAGSLIIMSCFHANQTDCAILAASVIASKRDRANFERNCIIRKESYGSPQMDYIWHFRTIIAGSSVKTLMRIRKLMAHTLFLK